jgi:LacI family transcriptional regulator
MSAQKPTIADVAAQAGVSIATVSRVMNRSGGVETALRLRVEAAARALSYLPNRYARGMRRSGPGGDEKLVGVILPSAADTFFAHALEEILRAAGEKGIRIILLSCQGDADREPACIESAAAAGIDGLLYCPCAGAGARRLFDFFPPGFPVVIFFRRAMVEGLPHIYYDNEQGGYLAAKYLLRQRRRRVAFLGSFWRHAGAAADLFGMLKDEKRGAYSALDRLAGYIRALEEYGVELREELLFPLTGFGFEAGRKGIRDFLARMCDFDAVMCANDEVAAGVIAGLREQQYAIPEAVSVIGYDDLSYATATRPALTTVRQDPRILGEGAVEMIHALMGGKTVEDHLIPMSLVIRESTAVKKT